MNELQTGTFLLLAIICREESGTFWGGEGKRLDNIGKKKQQSLNGLKEQTYVNCVMTQNQGHDGTYHGTSLISMPIPQYGKNTNKKIKSTKVRRLERS